MKLSGVLTHKVRGFRVVNLAALVVFLALALTVYAFKTSAGRERTDITDIETQIHDESRQVRLLQAEVARLESPDRLERLAGQSGQAPISARQEVAPDALATVASTPAAHP
jgi:cell division protein FtsL